MVSTEGSTQALDSSPGFTSPDLKKRCSFLIWTEVPRVLSHPASICPLVSFSIVWKGSALLLVARQGALGDGTRLQKTWARPCGLPRCVINVYIHEGQQRHGNTVWNTLQPREINRAMTCLLHFSKLEGRSAYNTPSQPCVAACDHDTVGVAFSPGSCEGSDSRWFDRGHMSRRNLEMAFGLTRSPFPVTNFSVLCWHDIMVQTLSAEPHSCRGDVQTDEPQQELKSPVVLKSRVDGPHPATHLKPGTLKL